MKSVTRVFTSWPMFLLLLMGFSSGLPLALTVGTLQAWMTDEGVDLKVIGFFALVGIPYTCKYLWAPAMDRYVPPFLGRRRGWMIICQLGLIAAISALAFSEPGKAPVFVAGAALVIAFLSASQDIVIDAYRAELLPVEELGAGAGVAILGYRLGMLTSGALALFLADHLPWRSVYLIMAAALLVGIFAAFAAPEPVGREAAPRRLVDAIFHPFIDYFRRSGSFEILAFIILYKLGEVMAVALTTPFMLSLDFTKTDIAAVTKVFGLIATISGSLIGGGLMVRLGTKRSLLIFGFCQALAPLCFAGLSVVGKHYPTMALAVGAENFCVGLGTAPFIAFLMSLCNKRFTGTQYALLTSLAALTRVFAGAPTGVMVENLGWTLFFILCTAAAFPGLLLLSLRFEKWATAPAAVE